MKKINWRKGSGTAIIGMTLILAIISIMIILVEISHYNSAKKRTQMITDIIADGSASYGSTILGPDEDMINDKADALAQANQTIDLYGNETEHLLYPIVFEYGSDGHSTATYFYRSSEGTWIEDRHGSTEITTYASAEVLFVSRISRMAVISKADRKLLLRILDEAEGTRAYDILSFAIGQWGSPYSVEYRKEPVNETIAAPQPYWNETYFFDDAALVQYSYLAGGIVLPGKAQTQYNYLADPDSPVDGGRYYETVDEVFLSAGDILFFGEEDSREVGIFLADNYMLSVKGIPYEVSDNVLYDRSGDSTVRVHEFDINSVVGYFHVN